MIFKSITIVKEIEQIGEFAYFNFQDLDGKVLMICNCNVVNVVKTTNVRNFKKSYPSISMG
jgi:hypothetical protein